MIDWNSHRFSDLLVEPVRNGVYKKKEFHGHGAKMVNMGELFAHSRLFDIPMKRVDLNKSELEKFSLESGDLLFARRSLTAEGAGKCSIIMEATEPTAFESSIIRARVDNKLASPQFLYYFFSSPVGRYLLSTIRRQVAVAGITGSDLSALTIQTPDLHSQRATAHLLSTLDDKIDLNRQMNETLEASARALFRDWFVDFGPTKAKMAGAAPYLAPDLWPLFPAQLDDAGVPKGWQTSTIGEEVSAVGGSTPSTKNEAFWNGNIAWTTPKDLSGLRSPALLETARSISEAGLAKISSGLLPIGTVLLSSRAPVGYLAITQIPMAVNQGYIAMKCEDRLSNWFVYLWAKENRALISQNANGSTFQEISKKNFRPLPILVPDTDTRDVFDSLVKPLFDRIVANEREIRTLAQTRDLLLPKLMSGEIRVGEAEQTISETA